MAQAETSEAQNGVQSSLSADAKCFVPGKIRASGTGTGIAGGGGRNSSGHLPKYVTSCYPFVQGDPGPSPRAVGQWQGPGRPSAPINSQYLAQQRHTLGPQQQNSIGYPGSRPPVSQNLPVHTPRGTSIHQRQAFSGSSPVVTSGPVLPNSQAAGFGNTSQAYNPYLPFPLGTAGAPPGWIPPVAGTFPAPFGQQLGARFFPPFSGFSGAESEDWNSWSERGRSCERSKSKKKKDGMVSIGIQNESGVLTGPVPKKKSKTKTIILMDAAIQTDFSDEIANLTLVEKPSPLYNNRRLWHDRFEEQSFSSTDSEEVDSDSGYSSPLHRRNLASSGTHPVGGLTYIPGSIIQPKAPAPFPFNPVLPPNVAFTYPVGAAGFGNPYLPQYQTPVSGQLPTKTVENPVVVHTRTKHLSGGSAKTDGEEEGTSRKGKRQWNKHWKNLGAGDDIGVLSDEPVDFSRTYSNSSMPTCRSSTDTLNVDTSDTFAFDDYEEFPDLRTATGSHHGPSSLAHARLSGYSDILKSQVSPLSQESCSSNDLYLPNSLVETRRPTQGGKESKTVRKRRKRREAADKAAEDELAEITLEQQVLKEFSSKQRVVPSSPQPPPPAPPPASKKKSQQPVSLNIAAMIDALEKQQAEQKAMEEMQKEEQQTIQRHEAKHKKEPELVANSLDASAPVKRGKEREFPKPKKPSPLKKVILKEREEKKLLRLLDDPDPTPLSTISSPSSIGSQVVAGMLVDSDLSQDTNFTDDSCSSYSQMASVQNSIGSKTSSQDLTGTCTPISADMSPISQTSPISMSPLSPGGSPLSSGVNSPIASNNHLMDERSQNVIMKIHSRRFREYCTQVLDKDIDASCTQFLQDLVRFQDRVYHKDPIKAKAKRRLVLGLREVTKHLKLRKIKCVIISPNLERIQSKGGLDDALNTIIQMCTDQDIPLVFALGRRALGRACAKLVPVSVVGIFNYEGAQEHFNQLMNLTEKARQAYKDMVKLMEKEIANLPFVSRTAGGVPQLYAHMGHSRTPSACSAISFTSSILSEPISENYPHSEPETDSRGYEIVKDKDPPRAMENMDVVSNDDVGNVMDDDDGHDAGSERSESPNSSGTSRGGKVTIVEALDEIDEGAEADVEDGNDNGSSSRQNSYESQLIDDCKDDDDEDTRNEEADLAKELPHIDSIHSSVVDLNAEILSQHSSRTPDLNADIMSTHSSKTLGDTGNISGNECPVEKPQLPLDPCNGREPGSLHKTRSLDKERIESWVAETQQQLAELCVSANLDSPKCLRETVQCNTAKDCKVAIKENGLKAISDDVLNENSPSTNCCSICDTKSNT